MRFLSFIRKREIYRIHASHVIRNVSLSIISVYIPIFLLSNGYSLSKTITFFITFHTAGLIFALFAFPSIARTWGLVKLFKLHYPVEISFLMLINFIPLMPWLFWLVAILGGLATFSYWMPMNILLIKNAEMKKMGSDLGTFFALPKIFGIFGPLISAALIPAVGFWPMFAVASIGLMISYLPLMGIKNNELSADFDFKISQAWTKLRERKLLFFLEGFDNILEESEWFWGIFVFLLIGSLEAPGIVGALEALGAATFTILVGKYANKNAKKLIPIAATLIILVWTMRLFIDNIFNAYAISIIASFLMTMFLVSYFSTIYKNVKDKNEEEFLILREISTVIGRIIVFLGILLTTSNPKLFFFVPIVATLILISIFMVEKNKLS